MSTSATLPIDAATAADPFANKTAYEEQNPGAERCRPDFEDRAARCNCCDNTALFSMMYRHGSRGTVVVWECPHCHDWRII